MAETESLTLDEQECLLGLLLLQYFEEEEDEEEYVSEDELEVKTCRQTNEKKGKQRKVVKADDSEETFMCMIDWAANRPEYPPRRIFINDQDAVGYCSKPMRKQLMESDVMDNQCRLLLGKDQVKKMMVNVLRKPEKLGTNGLKVSVYGPDGEIHKMVFKMWGKTKNTPVLMSSGWKNFVRKYNLQKHCNFLTVWMFRHIETRQICFAIDSTRFPVKDKLSPRISKAAF